MVEAHTEHRGLGIHRRSAGANQIIKAEFEFSLIVRLDYLGLPFVATIHVAIAATSLPSHTPVMSKPRENARRWK